MTESDRSEAAEIPAGAPSDIAAAPVVLDTDVPTPKKEGTDWWGEIKAIFWLVLAVLTFHSLIAKPFYIPSESKIGRAHV